MYDTVMVDVPAGDWVTVAEAAAMLKLTKRRVQVFIKEGRLRAMQVGILYLLRREDVKAFKPGKPGRPKKSESPAPPKKGRKK